MGDRRAALEVSNVFKRYGNVQALADVSLQLQRGRVSALVGCNGSGKTTLIKILAGVEQADQGWLTIDGSRYSATQLSPTHTRHAGLHIVHQGTTVFPELTVAENLAIGATFPTGRFGRVQRRRLIKHAKAVMHRFEVLAEPDQRLVTLSAAAQTMVAIARALQNQESEGEGILILDEPTAPLSVKEVDLLLGALRRYAAAGQAILFVTHSLAEVHAVADDVFVLRDGSLVGKLTGSDISSDAMMDLMVGGVVARRGMRGRSAAPSKTRLALKKVTSGRAMDVSLTVGAGEIVGLAGLMGSGRSSVLRALAGAARLEGGEILLDGRPLQFRQRADAIRTGIAYVPENRDRDAAFPTMDVTENLSAAVVSQYWRRGWLRRSAERADARELFGPFQIRAQSETAMLSTLSGGNQQKVMLARWLRCEPRVLLLDEPSQGIDVAARAQVHDIIRDFVKQGAAALVASSDVDELVTLCNRVLVMVGGRLSADVSGEALYEEHVHRLAHGRPRA